MRTSAGSPTLCSALNKRARVVCVCKGTLIAPGTRPTELGDPLVVCLLIQPSRVSLDVASINEPTLDFHPTDNSTSPDLELCDYGRYIRPIIVEVRARYRPVVYESPNGDFSVESVALNP